MNEKEKIAYLKALVYIATIDEDFDESEKQFIQKIANTYGLNQKQLEELEETVFNKKEDLDIILSAITDRKIKLLLIYELVALDYADGNYSDKEKSGIVNIGDILNVERSKIIEIEDLLNESVKLNEKIQMILER